MPPPVKKTRQAFKNARISRCGPPLSDVEKIVVLFFLLLQGIIFVCFQQLRASSSNSNSDNNNNKDGLDTARRGALDGLPIPMPFKVSTVSLDPEMAAAIKYVRSFPNLDQQQQRRRRLKFLHVPKTAGTAIEQVAAEHNISWGNCMFYHRPKRKICPYPGGYAWPGDGVGWWHLPAQFFPLAQSNPYHGAELFAVIRDPLDRLVSEFQYACTLKNKEWRPNRCDQSQLSNVTYMNAWLRHKFQTISEALIQDAALSYLTDNGHFTPQYEYLVAPFDVRMVDYVLFLDYRNKSRLQDQFQNLVQAFGLQFLELREMQSISSHNLTQNLSLASSSSVVATTTTTTTVGDLDSATLAWSKRKYANDIWVVNQFSRLEQ